MHQRSIEMGRFKSIESLMVIYFTLIIITGILFIKNLDITQEEGFQKAILRPKECTFFEFI